MTEPLGLSSEALAIYRQTLADYDLEPWHVRILLEALRSLDRAEQARRQLDAEGLTIDGRFGPRPHPLLTVERDARSGFARLMKQLGLDIEGRK